MRLGQRQAKLNCFVPDPCCGDSSCAEGFMKTSVIAAALGLSLLLAFAWRADHDGALTSKAAATAANCYADGRGPDEPTICT